jgi:hypothetical protein
MASFSVRVMNSKDQPRRGVRVGANFGVLRGSASGYSDRDGWATLSMGANASAEIYVDGQSQGTHYVTDGATFSFTVDYR